MDGGDERWLVERARRDVIDAPAPSVGAAKVAAVILAREAAGGSAARVHTGAQAIGETAVGGGVGRWFTGIWEPDGRWRDTPDWLTLVWERGGYLYHLTGQGLPLAELVRVAESPPAAP